MDADKFVEEGASERLERPKARNGEEECSCPCEDETDDALEVSRMPDPCRSTEEEMGGVHVPATCHLDRDAAAVGVTQNADLVFVMGFSLHPALHPLRIVIHGPGARGFRLGAEPREIRSQNRDVRARERRAELIEGLF